MRPSDHAVIILDVLLSGFIFPPPTHLLFANGYPGRFEARSDPVSCDDGYGFAADRLISPRTDICAIYRTCNEGGDFDPPTHGLVGPIGSFCAQGTSERAKSFVQISELPDGG